MSEREDDLVHIALNSEDLPPIKRKHPPELKLEDQQSSEYFDASPHTSEDEDDEDKSDPGDLEYVDGPKWFNYSENELKKMGLSDEEDDDGYFDSSEVRDLISSVHDFVSMRESPSARESDRYSDLPTISEDVRRELQGQVEFYKTNLMQVESKYTMLLETYQKVENSNREKEKILKNYLVVLQRASLTPEYVIELQETIIKLKGEIGVLQQQLMRNNAVDEEFTKFPTLERDKGSNSGVKLKEAAGSNTTVWEFNNHDDFKTDGTVTDSDDEYALILGDTFHTEYDSITFCKKSPISSQPEFASPAVTDITEYSSPDIILPDNYSGRYYKLEEENKLLKATIEQLRAEVQRLSAESKSNSSTNIQITSNIQVDSNISSNLPDIGDRAEIPTLNEDRALRLLLSDSFLDEFTQRIAQKLSVPEQIPPLKEQKLARADTPRSRTKTRPTMTQEKAKDTTKRKRLKTPAQRNSRPIRPKSPRPQPKKYTIEPISIERLPENKISRKKVDVKKTKPKPAEALSPVRRLSLSDQLEKLKKSYQTQRAEFQAKQKAFEQQKKHMTAKEAKKVELEIRRVKNRLNDRKTELRKLKKLISDPTTDKATAQKV